VVQIQNIDMWIPGYLYLATVGLTMNRENKRQSIEARLGFINFPLSQESEREAHSNALKPEHSILMY